MNGLSLRPLTPNVDAPLMMPRSALYCELGFMFCLDRKTKSLYVFLQVYIHVFVYVYSQR